MSLNRDKYNNDIIFRCDSDDCGDSIETGTVNFDEALSILYSNRWTSDKHVSFRARGGFDFQHFCQQCSDEIARIKEDAVDNLLKGVPKK